MHLICFVHLSFPAASCHYSPFHSCNSFHLLPHPPSDSSLVHEINQSTSPLLNCLLAWLQSDFSSITIPSFHIQHPYEHHPEDHECMSYNNPPPELGVCNQFEIVDSCTCRCKDLAYLILALLCNTSGLSRSYT